MEPVATSDLAGNTKPQLLESNVQAFFATDVRQLDSLLGAEGYASARFSLFGKASVEAEYATSGHFSSRHTFVVVKGEALYTTESFDEFKLRKDALALLQKDPNAFFRRCGDQFISGRTPGAAVLAVAELRDTHKDEKDSFEAGFSIDTLIGSGGASGRSETRLRTASKRLSYQVFQTGLATRIPRPQDLSAFLDLARDLPARLGRTTGVPVAFNTKPYSTASNFPHTVRIPSLARQHRALERLAKDVRAAEIALNDLRIAKAENKPCEGRERRYATSVTEVEGFIDQVDKRAVLCAEDPMRECRTGSFPTADYRSDVSRFIHECSDREAAQRRRDHDRELKELEARQARRAIAERAAQAKARREKNRGKPDGDPCGSWLLTQVSIELPTTNKGYGWDRGSGPNSRPDPFVRLTFPDKKYRETSYRQDTFRASFTISPAVKLKPGQRVQARAWDYDGGDRQYAGEVSVFVGTRADRSGRITVNDPQYKVSLGLTCKESAAGSYYPFPAGR